MNTYVCVSGGKKCSFFEQFDVLSNKWSLLVSQKQQNEQHDLWVIKKDTWKVANFLTWMWLTQDLHAEFTKIHIKKFRDKLI